MIEDDHDRRVPGLGSQAAGSVDTPTLAEWIGGANTLDRLIAAFYARVPSDPLIGPVFSAMGPEHVQHVADFIAEVFGAGPLYTQNGGSHAGMIRHHMNRNLTEAQRHRWVELLLQTADELDIPSDPEFRSAFVGYIEWGSRLALLNSQSGTDALEDSAPMPLWNWGPPGGPWRGSGA